LSGFLSLDSVKQEQKKTKKSTENTIPLSTENLLIRATTLRNTDFVIGMVIFTGRDTKFVLNSAKTPSKVCLFV